MNGIEARLETALLWWRETLPSRVNDPLRSAIVVIMQRVHERDISGEIIAKEMGYDLIEVCIEDPAVVSAEALKKASERTGLPVSICGAFGPDRDVSHEDPQKRRQGIHYLKLCVDIAQAVTALSCR